MHGSRRVQRRYLDGWVLYQAGVLESADLTDLSEERDSGDQPDIGGHELLGVGGVERELCQLARDFGDLCGEEVDLAQRSAASIVSRSSSASVCSESHCPPAYLLKLLADPLGLNLRSSVSHGPARASLLVRAALFLVAAALKQRLRRAGV